MIINHVSAHAVNGEIKHIVMQNLKCEQLELFIKYLISRKKKEILIVVYS